MSDRDDQYRKTYQQEQLAFAAGELISEAMNQKGISDVLLSRNLGRGDFYIKLILQHPHHIKLFELSDVMTALGYGLEVRLVPMRPLDFLPDETRKP